MSETTPFEVAGNQVDPAGLWVTVGASEVRPEAKAMQGLIYLAKQAGRAVNGAELAAQIWPGRVVTEDSVIGEGRESDPSPCSRFACPVFFQSTATLIE